MLRIFANPLFAHYLYSRSFTWIIAMWDYFSIFMCAGDVATRGACDCVIKS